MFLLVISEILGLSLNTKTTDDKYSLPITENLPQPIQMQLSQKWKTFSEFFAAFMKTASNFQHSEKIDDPYS